MVHCPACRTEYAEEMPRCPECGAENPGPAVRAAPERRATEDDTLHKCARCGQEFRGGDACPACGKLVVEAPCQAHPDRVAIGRCVLCGRAACEECADSGQRALLCPEHRAVPIIEGWAQVYSTASEVEAQLVRENLVAEGIDAQMYSQKDRTLTVDLGELAIVRVLVPFWEYEAALELITDYMDSEGEVGFACPSCGEVYEPGAATCASCGASLV